MKKKQPDTQRRTIALDFDGVIHHYREGWKGPLNIYDTPVPGAFDFIRQSLVEFDVVIFSARLASEAAESAIKSWFTKHGLDKSDIKELKFSAIKPPAVLYIDDRGYHFDGTFPSLEFIRSFTPWQTNGT